LQSTRSSGSSPGDGGRRPSRAAIAILVLLSLAIPAGVLAVIVSRADRGPSPTPTTTIAPIDAHKARVGSHAPDFALPSTDGNTVTLSGLRGRPVVIVFFASWCHPCEEDMPALQRAQDDNAGRVTVVGVNYQDFPGDTRAFVQRLGVKFPALVEDSSDNPVARQYDVHAMPDTVFIDASGVVRDRVFGQTSTHDLEQALQALLRA
jgi:cytochrome c biogenesis protein CcmG, thiol:disulfide interchange protein DsbE